MWSTLYSGEVQLKEAKYLEDINKERYTVWFRLKLLNKGERTYQFSYQSEKIATKLFHLLKLNKNRFFMFSQKIDEDNIAHIILQSEFNKMNYYDITAIDGVTLKEGEKILCC